MSTKTKNASESTQSSKTGSTQESTLSKTDGIKKPRRKAFRLKLGCEIYKKAYTRNQLRVPNEKNLPLAEVMRQYSKKRAPAAPTQSAVHGLAKVLISHYEKKRITDNRLKRVYNSEKSNTSSNSSSLTEKNVEGQVNVTFSGGARIVSAVDKCMEGLFTIVSIMMTRYTPALSETSFNKQALTAASNSSKDTVEKKTVTAHILYQAWKTYISNIDYAGPKFPESLLEIESCFGLFYQLENMKPKKPERLHKNENPDQIEKYKKIKEAYKEKKEALLEKARGIIEEQFPTNLYVGGGLKGALKRYSVERASKPVGTLLEVIGRVFINELIYKSHQYITVRGGGSINEDIIGYCLNTCGFTCQI